MAEMSKTSPIPFTQYVLPDGRQRSISIERPANVADLATRFIERGGRFEAEVLTTNEVSLTAVKDVDGEPEDIAIRICANGPGIEDAVDSLVREVATA